MSLMDPCPSCGNLRRCVDRAESAEAAHAALVAGVEALAEQWADDYPGPDAACSRTPDEWAIDLRALLAGYGPTEYIKDEHDCDGSDEHLPCWPACTTRTPAEPDAGEVEALGDLIAEARDEYPRTHDDMDSGELAYRILTSDWLAALLDRVRREAKAEAGERIAQAIEAGVLPSHPNDGYKDGFRRAARIARSTP